MRHAAIFDLDGTLIPMSSAERTFFFYLFRNKILSIINIFQMLEVLWTFHGNMHSMLRGNKRYLKNKPVDSVENIARSFFEPKIDNLIFPVMLKIVRMHREKGDLLLLLSGTIDIIADCFIRRLYFDGGIAGKLEKKNGRFTGALTGILPYGIGKLEVLSELKRVYNFDLNETTLYANIYSDRFVMNAVANPKVVNPDKRLRLYAKKRHWEIIEVQ
jgi:HAD superfamily hydrolase (TIGR01490 family)